jgi:hypothetical protein
MGLADRFEIEPPAAPRTPIPWHRLMLPVMLLATGIRIGELIRGQLERPAVPAPQPPAAEIPDAPRLEASPKPFPVPPSWHAGQPPWQAVAKDGTVFQGWDAMDVIGRARAHNALHAPK